MPYLGFSLLVSIIAIVHVIKTGRSQLWIMVLLALPVLGAAAYFVVEVLPELANGRRGSQTKRSLGNALDNTFSPNKTLDDAKREYSLSKSAENACSLAAIYSEKGNYAQAAELYSESLIGLNEHDPEILYRYADARFHMAMYAETRDLLDRCIEQNPDYKNQDAHLLYARALQALKDNDKAAEEYETLITYYTGPEPAYHYAQLLKSIGSTAEAHRMFSSIIEKSSQSPDHYRRLHRRWIDLAKKEL